MKVMFWKPRCPVLWMLMYWKGCPQEKLVSSITSLPMLTASQRDAYLFLCHLPFSVFSLPMYVSLFLNPFAFSKEENVVITGCGGGNTGFWSLQPYRAVIHPTTDLGGNEFTICRVHVSLQPSVKNLSPLALWAMVVPSRNPAGEHPSLLWVTLSEQYSSEHEYLWFCQRQLFEAKLFVLVIWASKEHEDVRKAALRFLRLWDSYLSPCLWNTEDLASYSSYHR